MISDNDNRYVRQVLRLSNGSYIGDTADARARAPDAVPVTIQMPTREEAKNGQAIKEIKPKKRRAKSKPADGRAPKAPPPADPPDPTEGLGDFFEG